MQPDESLEILRRLEPVVTHIVTRLDKIETRLDKIETRLDKVEVRLDKIEIGFEKLDERLRKVEVEVAGLQGRVSQLPTTWTMAGLIFAIFGASLVLLRLAAP